MSTAGMIVEIVGGLGLFLYGMKVMSEALQKVARDRLRRALAVMTGNRFLGVGTGFLVTSAIQSSSATTVMLVSFVHAGLVDLVQSIGVIMGANIGTTVTGWLVALVGFRLKIAAMALPAIAIGFFARFLKVQQLTDWGQVLIGFGLLFLGLDFMKDAVGGLRQSENILGWIAAANADHLGPRLVAVLIGALITVIIQSSSATMAITMTLAVQGMIDLPTACALILGENIGTTITANLAAISASRTAKRTARAHFVFNIAGVVWALILFMPFLTLVDYVVPGEVVAGGDTQTAVGDHMAGFHTGFNLINTLIFLPLVRPMAWLATRMVPGGREPEPESFRLQYLDNSLISAVPMALQAARGELSRMLDEVRSMFDKVVVLIARPDEKLGDLAQQVQAAEFVVDRLETEIAAYMVRVTGQSLSEAQSHEAAGILSAISDLERMGDHCEALLRLARRRYDKRLAFDDRSLKELGEIAAQVGDFLDLLARHIVNPETNIMPRAEQIEQNINEMRRQMRKTHVKRLQAGDHSVTAGLVLIDMLTSFEKMGDHAFNVAQVLSGVR